MRALLAVLCFGMALSASQAADWSTIRIGTEGVYPPWNATGDDGELEGFEIDLARDLCRRMDARCRFVTQSWDGMLPALTTGKYDLLMAGMAITAEREQIIDFSTCYAADVATFAVRPDNALAATIAPAERIDLTTFPQEVKAAISALRSAAVSVREFPAGDMVASVPGDGDRSSSPHRGRLRTLSLKKQDGRS